MSLLLEPMNGYLLFAVLVLCIWVLSKATDILVDEAVSLSLEWGMSQLVIGATIVSLGTSLPELAVSISSSLKWQRHSGFGKCHWLDIRQHQLHSGDRSALWKHTRQPKNGA